MTDAPANADQIAYWNAIAGQTWATQQALLDRQIEPLGARAMAALQPKPGEAILDIGCGCGQTTLALAQAVAPSGLALGLDISRPMLDIANARAKQAHLANATFLEADAQTHAFEPAKYDAAFSRFGVMFFNDPAAAFTNIVRALKPGARLAFVCWRPLSENPWMSTPLEAARGIVEAPQTAPDPTAPGPFAFTDSARVHNILKSAGFTNVRMTAHDTKIGGNSLDDSVALALLVGPLGALLREQAEKKPAAAAAVRKALAPFDTAEGVLQPASCWIVEARR